MTYLIRPIGGKVDAELKAKFLDCMGAKNEWHQVWPLPNLKEITEYDYWHANMSYSNKLYAYAGSVKHEEDHATLHVYFNDLGRHQLGGYAVLFKYGWPVSEGWVKYFEWGRCSHVFDEKRISNCYHRYTCKLCQSSYDVDSSG